MPKKLSSILGAKFDNPASCVEKRKVKEKLGQLSSLRAHGYGLSICSQKTCLPNLLWWKNGRRKMGKLLAPTNMSHQPRAEYPLLNHYCNASSRVLQWFFASSRVLQWFFFQPDTAQARYNLVENTIFVSHDFELAIDPPSPKRALRLSKWSAAKMSKILHIFCVWLGSLICSRLNPVKLNTSKLTRSSLNWNASGSFWTSNTWMYGRLTQLVCVLC
jgi:hypothetical protein